MPVLNARPTDRGAISPNGDKTARVMTYQPADYLRAVATNATFETADARPLSATHPTLSTLTEQARRTLLRWSRCRNVKRREVICRQGDLAGAVILVVEGYLKRSISLSDGAEVLLDMIGPGDCAGEMTALQDRPHDADLTALSRCRLLMIDARQFRQAFDREPDGLLAIMRTAAERLQRVTEQLLDSRALAAPGRLAKALLYLAKLPSSGAGSAACFRLRLSQSELGAMAGVCREVVNKHLGVWRDAGWIKMSGGSVISIDTAAISNMLQNEMYAEVGAGAFSRDDDLTWRRHAR
jgi:CRP/FNR family cyclic AMP-dependent transcriptional regulator